MSEKDKNNLGKKKDERRDLQFGVAYFFIYITHLFISCILKILPWRRRGLLIKTFSKTFVSHIYMSIKIGCTKTTWVSLRSNF